MSNSFFGPYYIFTFSVIYAVLIMSLVVAIAFFTVLERKVLAAIQRRRGPNVVGYWGLLQAFADGIKLLLKEPLFVSGSNYYIFLMAPMLLLAMSLTLWIFMPLPGFKFGVDTTFSFIVVFLFSSLNSFAIILAGVASNSRYSLIGGVRAIAQLISYELPLSISLLTLFCIQGNYSLYSFSGSKIIYTAIALPALIVFFISLLAETNRTPFDLPEAEAELVAGYNLEYSSILFSLFFLAEYSNILFASSLLSLLCFSGYWFYLGVIFFCLIIILVRAILPRYTFAQLINLCWCSLFPVSLLILIFTSVVIYLLNAYFADIVNVELAAAIDGSLPRAFDGVSRLAYFIPLTHYLNYPIKNAKYTFDYSNLPYPVITAEDLKASLARKHDVLAACKESVRAYKNSIIELEGELSGVSVGNVVIFFSVALLIVFFLVGLNWVVINFKSNNKKNSPFECGYEPVGSPITEFSPNFVSVGLIFLIYDVEILLTLPWAHSLVGRSAGALAIFILFILIMLLGLVFEVLDGSFDIV